MRLLTILILVLAYAVNASAQNFTHFSYIIEKSIKYRNEVVKAHDFLKEVNVKENVLSGKDIAMINAETLERANFGEAAFEYLGDLEHLVKKRVKKKYQPTDYDLKDAMILLATGVTMYDNFLFAYLKLNEFKKVRRLLNSKDDAIGKKKNLFKKALRKYFKLKYRKYIRRAIKIYKKFYLANKEKYADDQEMLAIESVISQSYTYEKLANQNFWGRLKDFFKILGKKFKVGARARADFFNKVGNGIVFGLSQFFGNTVGMLQSRRGYLFNDHAFIEKIANYAQPMDLIFEKTPFRATDKFIPGYWGHTAIYIGNEEQIKELGIWEHPMVVKYHEQIRMGKTIVESLRSGVEINSIKHFTDIDDFALLRSRTEWSKQELGEHVIRALSQVGKNYDFGFDVETPSTIVCSELQYSVYHTLDFKTTKILGRYTIDVDQVSEKGISGQPFEPHLIYLDGKEVKHELQKSYDIIFKHADDATKIRTLINEIQEEAAEQSLEESAETEELDLQAAAM